MSVKPIMLLVLASGLFVSCSKFSKVLKSKDYEYKLKMAEQYFAKKSYRQAQTLFDELFPIYKGSPQFEDLYYKYAYCHYNLRDYMTAENLFKGYLEVFPNSPRAEEVEYMQAYSFYRQSPKPELDQSNTIKAMGMLQVFINTHPGSARNREAEQIIATCNLKLEKKEHASAQLYYDLGHFRAAALAFATLINNFPESASSDEYKLMSIRAYYRFASMSIEEKQQERFEKVVSEVQDFQDRFPDSKLLKEAERYLELSNNQIKKGDDEMTRTRRQSGAAPSNVVDTRDTKQIKLKTGNIYESIAIIAKRANQINITLKEELHNKLEEFATHTDSLEEVHENKEQIEISRAYEKMPNPALLATQEFMNDKIYFRKNEEDLFR